MSLASIERDMLQHARNESDLTGSIDGEKGMRRTPEIVQTHGFAKFPKGTRISDVIDAASGEGTPFVGGPKTLMMAATNDASKIMREIRDNRFWHPEAFFRLDFVSSG